MYRLFLQTAGVDDAGMPRTNFQLVEAMRAGGCIRKGLGEGSLPTDIRWKVLRRLLG